MSGGGKKGNKPVRILNHKQNERLVKLPDKLKHKFMKDEK